MLAIFFHVLHGFSSGFQSLGLITSKTRKYFQALGMIYALLIPILFAIIPIYIYLGYILDNRLKDKNYEQRHKQ